MKEPLPPSRRSTTGRRWAELPPLATEEASEHFRFKVARALAREQVTERGISILALGVLFAFLYIARDFLFPSVLAAFVALILHPLVQLLVRRLRVPRSIAALLGTVLAVLVLVVLVLVLVRQINSFASELPDYEDRLRDTWRSLSQKFSKLQQSGEALVPTHPRQVRTVQGVPWETLLFGTAMGALTVVGQATVAVFLLYFLLAEAGNFRRKLIRLLRGDPGAEGRILRVLDQIQHDVEQYLLNRVVLNTILGFVTWGAFALYGLEHAAVWGLTTALLHFIPYLGPAVGLAFPVLMALLQYGNWRDPLVVGLVYTAIVGLQGNLVDPIFFGKQLRLNALAVFIGSVFWFWFWGPLGLFLAVPILSVLRIVSVHTQRLKWLGEFLAA